MKRAGRVFGLCVTGLWLLGCSEDGASTGRDADAASGGNTAVAGSSGQGGGVAGASGGGDASNVAGAAGAGSSGAGNTAGSGGSSAGAAGASSGGSAGTGPTGNKALCAETTYANCEATDFSKEDIFDNPKWTISTWGNENRTHSSENLWVEDGALVMRVNGGSADGEQTVGAEIVSTRSNFLYGSFRTMAKTATEPGTVNSPLFYYLNDTSEIDVEILSVENPQHFVNFTVHERSDGDDTYRLYDAGFDPSADFHEYRFDWSPEGVTYYIDGEPTGVTLTGNTPSDAGRILVNHWTLSDPGWGGGPPLNDAFMYVKYMEFYFD